MNFYPFSTLYRVGEMVLPHSSVDTPVFMPVGTQGTMKGLTPEQLGKRHNSSILENQGRKSQKSCIPSGQKFQILPN